jgi:O-antigen ligase
MNPRLSKTRSRHEKTSSPLPNPRWATLATAISLWAGRIAAVAILVACPWYYGSVTWTAQIWVVPAVGLVFFFAISTMLFEFVLTAPRRTPVVLRSPIVIALLALLLIAILQSTPLPVAIWNAISPGAEFNRRVAALAETYQVEPDSDASDMTVLQKVELLEPGVLVSPSPTTLSIDPIQSSASGAVFASGLAFLISAGILFRGQTGSVLLLSAIAITALSNTIFGLFQSVAGGPKLLEMPSELYFATFVSRNSAPQFICIGMGAAIGLLAWWVKTKSGDEAAKRYHVRYPAVNALARLRRRLEELLLDLDLFSIILVFMVTFMLVGVIAAASRGGILACAFAVFVTLAITLGKQKEVLIRTLGLMVLIACAAVLLLTTLNLETTAIYRLNTISAEAHQLNNGRLDVWRLSVREPAYWLAGCGLGTFHFGILPCYDGTESFWFYHAENIFVELFVEFGIAGFLIGAAGVASLIWQIFRERDKSSRNTALFPAVVFASSAVILQSLVDFSLIIPAIFLPLAAIVGCFLGDLSPGKKTSRSKSLRAPKPQVERTASWLLPAVQFLGLATIGFTMFGGYNSLQGYAAAERLEKQLENWTNPIDGENVDLPRVQFTPELLRHPEFALQMARLEQAVFEAELNQSKYWPNETPVALKDSLCTPENVAASVRGGTQGKLAALNEVLAQAPDLMAQLAATRERMELAASASPMDWRPAWGIVRSDLGEISATARANNYAKLALVTKHHPVLASVVGTTAFLARERNIGIEFWRAALLAKPEQSSQLTQKFLGEVIDGEALNELLPKTPLMRIEFARALLETKLGDRASDNAFVERLNRAAELILPDADISKISSYARSSQDWRAVGWLGERIGAIDDAVEAYAQAANKAPQDHALRAYLARFLKSNGRLSEAIDQMKIAYKYRQVDDYKKLLDAWEEELEN